MRKSLRWLILSLAMSAVPPVATANPIRLSFSLEPAESIPGLPVTFRITASNSGSAPAKLPTYVHLQLIPESGEPEFLLFNGSERRGMRLPLEIPREGLPRSIELAPGEQKRLDFIGGSAPWLDHPRLREPGSYRLRLFTDERFMRDDPGDLIDPIVSNEVILTLREPSGIDGEVYRLYRNTDLQGDALAAELWSRYPDSIYTAMTVRPYPQNDRRAELESFEATLGKARLVKNPPPGFGDSLRLSAGMLHLMFMDDALTNEGNIQKALQHSEAARVLLEELVNKETEFELKQQAKNSLEQVRTFDELKEWHERRSGFLKPCARQIIEAWRVEVAGFLSGSRPPEAKKKIEALLPHIDAFLAEASKTPPDMVAALGVLEKAAGDLEEAIRKQFLDETTSRKWAERIGSAALLPVVKGIEAAEKAADVDRKKLDAARADLEIAKTLFSASDLKKAVAKSREAMHKAWSASSVRGGVC